MNFEGPPNGKMLHIKLIPMQPQIPIDCKKSAQAGKENAYGYHATKQNSYHFDIW